MRQKTDEKRQSILDVATELFLTHGYESVSMSQISESVGGSKATLYGYFSNKEDLFLEVVSDGIKRMVQQISVDDQKELSFEEKLRFFALNYLRNALSDEAIALRRTVISIASKKNDAGQKIYSQVIKGAWEYIATILEKEMQEGKIKKTDSFELALCLKSMLENVWVDRRLFCIDSQPTSVALEKHVDNVLNIFLNFYYKQ